MSRFHRTYRNKKVLVIGGSGFIGSNLVQKFIDIGVDVSMFDKKIRTSLKQYQPYPGDLRDFKSVENVIKQKFDLVFHCAGYSGQIPSQENPYQSFESNVVGTINLLESVRKYSGATKILLIGSRLEYGKPHYLPVDENHPTEPISFYGIDRLTSSMYALHYSKTYEMPVVIFRVSNAYGPHPAFHFTHYNVINSFIDSAIKKKALTIFGKGQQIRDYLYIDDLTEALLLAGANKRANSQIYNVGYGKPITFKKMLKIIAHRANVNIEHSPWPSSYRQLETGDYVTDIRKIRQHLHWGPKISPEQGVELCFEITS